MYNFYFECGSSCSALTLSSMRHVVDIEEGDSNRVPGLIKQIRDDLRYRDKNRDSMVQEEIKIETKRQTELDDGWIER